MATEPNTPPRAEPRHRVWPWVAAAVVLLVLIVSVVVPNASRMAQSGSPATTPAGASAPAGTAPATDETNPPPAAGRPD